VQSRRTLAVILKTEMRKTFTLILLIGFATLFGQNLKFDIMVKYSKTYKDNTYESSSYAISSNDKYMMRIINQHDGKVAKIFDLISLKCYSYKLIESKSDNNEITYIFEYINTFPYERTPINISAKDFEFESLSTSDNIEKVNMKLYKNKSRKKIKDSLELTILKSEINLFPVFRFSCLHTLEHLIDLNYIKAGLVTNCISKDNSTKYTLLAFEEVNLEIRLPN